MVSSGSIILSRAAMMIAVLLALSTTNLVRGQNQCNDDHDCPAKQYCYDVSNICVNFTKCERHNRMEAAVPARQPSGCGSCLPGYVEEILATGEISPLCKLKKTLQESARQPSAIGNWSRIWIGCLVLGGIVIIILIALLVVKIKKCAITNESASGRFFEKVNFLTARPTAPPQDDGQLTPAYQTATYSFRGASYTDEERPPVYASVIGPSIDKDHLVNATPSTPPVWVRKPSYQPDYNDNVADGAAILIHSSSTNLQMEMEDEGETNPSSWTPGQMTVDLPARPFALFANSEQQDNVRNNVLMRGNCSSDSHEESTSEDSSEVPEEPAGSQPNGSTYCGPNVLINQTITLNIAKNGTK